MAYNTGIMIPPQVTLTFDGAPVISATAARLTSLRLQANGAPGMATVAWSAALAQGISADMGRAVSIALGAQVLLRGVIAEGPVRISTSEDTAQAAIVCDKWRMAARIIGEAGTGTLPAEGEDQGREGFSDVGFDIVCNPDGRPNRKPDTLDFSTGSDAVYWTLADCLRLVFEHYVDPELAVLPESLEHLGATWAHEPTGLDLAGMAVPQALDAICEQAGAGWTLSYGAINTPSLWAVVHPTLGTERTVSLFEPKDGKSAKQAGEYHATEISPMLSILHARDDVHMFSAPAVVELTYDNINEPHLLQGAWIEDKEYRVRYYTNVLAYQARGLGRNLSAGSPPKPWLQRLVTRQDPATGAYLTAAEIAADPALRNLPTLEQPFVWIALDKDADPILWRRVAGGYRIDFENATIDFRTEIEIYTADGETETITIGESTWPQVGVELTVATITGEPAIARTAAESLYLPQRRSVREDRSDLVPEKRFKSVLPDPNSPDPNAAFIWAHETEETYVDVSSQLSQALAAALAAESAPELRIRASFAFVPPFAIGERMSFSGRLDLGLSTVVIDAIDYQFADGVASYLTCQGTTSARSLGERRRGKR